MKNHILLFTICLLWLAACSPKLAPEVAEDYTATIEQWQAQRLASLTIPSGWLSLTGLTWLQEGENTVGSAAEADVQLPAGAPELAATYTLVNGQVSCEPHHSTQLLDAQACAMQHGSHSWQLIERAGRYGIRSRDTLLPSRIRLMPLEQFAIDPNYQVYAYWTPATTADSVLMRNVLDMEYYLPLEGTLAFTLQGQAFELQALDGGPNDLFLIFSDDTTGDSTYGGGRYLYCPRPDQRGRTVVDFNKAYNPPCAFTAYATCLLPRAENHLALSVQAGEKTYGDH